MVSSYSVTGSADLTELKREGSGSVIRQQLDINSGSEVNELNSKYDYPKRVSSLGVGVGVGE